MISNESCFFELNIFLWHHWKCGFTQLEAASINQLHASVANFVFGCSGGFKALRSEMKVSLETTIETFNPVDLGFESSHKGELTSNHKTTVVSQSKQ